jgi:glycosyltransferase 2 family protein
MLSLAILVGMIVFASRRSESKQFAEIIRHAKPNWLLAAVVLQLGTYVSSAMVLKLGLNRSNAKVPLHSLLPLGFMKLAADQVLPTGGVTGTVFVVHALEKRKIRVSVSTAAVVVGLLGYHAANAFSILSAVTILWVRGDLHKGVLLPVTIVSVVTAIIPVVLIWLARGGARKTGGWVRRLPGVKQLLDAIASAPRSTLEDGRLFAYDALLQFSIIALDAATLYVLFLSLGQAVDIKTVFAAFVLASLAGAISLLPGGVGPFEAGSVAVFGWLGVPFALAVSGTLLYRAFTLWLPMAPGVLLARRELAKENPRTRKEA